jgi:hypothetical protein
MTQLDLKKTYRHLYSPSAKKVEVVQVPRLQFAMIDGEIEAGHGPGTSPAFESALGALYGISYTLKFASKQRKEDPIDYPVMALEGLWWVEGRDFDITRPQGWHYTVMILQPEHITGEMFQQALAQLRKKKGDQPAFAALRLESFEEGLCMQTLHLGPYATEMETIARMDEFARANGYQPHGKHHEIYMGDPRRGDPAKLKTILRHPLAKAVGADGIRPPR